MHLRKAYIKMTGRTYLSIVHGYRDTKGKTKSKVIKSLGYLDELQKQYNDPIAHFTNLAKAMDEERKINNSVTVTLDLNEPLDPETVNRKNYGCVLFSKIYHELEIDRFLDNARRHKKFNFNSEAIMRLLLYSRLLYPGSKRAAVMNKDHFFDKFDFSLDDVYDGLTHFHHIGDRLQKHLHDMVTEQYGRKTNLVYYDVTNYYFEIDKQDELRKRGCAKQRRDKPIIQMGLLLDTDSLPITYKLFPGNTHDSQTLMPILADLKKRFETKRIIIVADKGLNSGDNIVFNTALGDGYIYSKSVRGASADFQEWLLEERGYRCNPDITDSSFKVKSKTVPDAEVSYTAEQEGKKKKKKTVKIEQKWVAFYSRKYAERAKHKRAEVIAKALQMIKSPSKYRNNCDYGAAGYIKNIQVDKETGEIKNTEDFLYLDEERIAEEERLDGYYAIVTSELDEPDEEIIKLYRGLWRIEESFKITKSVLGTRPVYLKTPEHVNAHFLICFLALLIARIIEKRLNGKYTIERITETLQKVACSHLQQNVWLFDYADSLTAELQAVFGIDFGRKNMTLQEIKNNFAQSKV
jgi:transposase